MREVGVKRDSGFLPRLSLLEGMMNWAPLRSTEEGRSLDSGSFTATLDTRQL